MIAKHQITLFLPAKMNVACRMKDCELHNMFKKKKGKKKGQTHVFICGSLLIAAGVWSRCHPQLQLHLSILLSTAAHLSSLRFSQNNFRLEGLADPGYEAWLDEISFTGWEYREHVPTQHFSIDAREMAQRDICSPLMFPWRLSLFRLDLIQALLLSRRKWIPCLKSDI